MTDNKTVKVLFCSDGSELNIDISLQATLEDLKHQITNQKLIESKYQRVFHLGREMKNSRRSLHALGIGRFGSFVVHLQSSKPKLIELASEKKKSLPSNSTRQDASVVASIDVDPIAASSDVIDATESNRSSGNSRRGRKRGRGANAATGTSRTEAVINLLESDDDNNDDDDDDDDDDIEVIEIDKRTRRR